MLTKTVLAQLKARLEEEKKRLEEELGDVSKRDKKVLGHFEAAYEDIGSNSEDDNAIEVSNYSDEIPLVAKLETELRDTIQSLEAMKAGTYGICKYCHKEIDVKRLEARPTSSTCIACKKFLTQEM